jgi:hypothetical protein
MTQRARLPFLGTTRSFLLLMASQYERQIDDGPRAVIDGLLVDAGAEYLLG